jgi:hypothetical protein
MVSKDRVKLELPAAALDREEGANSRAVPLRWAITKDVYNEDIQLHIMVAPQISVISNARERAFAALAKGSSNRAISNKDNKNSHVPSI